VGVAGQKAEAGKQEAAQRLAGHLSLFEIFEIRSEGDGADPALSAAAVGEQAIEEAIDSSEARAQHDCLLRMPCQQRSELTRRS
jgi:hypothetical protein